MPFASREMIAFAKDWGFELVTSSSRYPRSNGQVKRHVQTIKQLMRKAREEGQDVYKVLLDYRNSPVSGLNYSLAQLLMSRRLKSSLPVSAALLQPSVPSKAKEARQGRLLVQQRYYNRGTRNLLQLEVGDSLRIRQRREWQTAVIMQKHWSRRSYLVVGQVGMEYRRNRKDLQTFSGPPPEIRPLEADISHPSAKGMDPLKSTEPSQCVIIPSETP